MSILFRCGSISVVYILGIKRAIGHFIRLSFPRAASRAGDEAGGSVVEGESTSEKPPSSNSAILPPPAFPTPFRHSGPLRGSR